VNQISDNGIAHIKRWEGFKTRAYLDTGSVWTIGYGHTGKKYAFPNNEITEEKAEELLRQDINWAEDAVNDLVKVVLTQNQFDTLVSFVFNIGKTQFSKSTLLKKLNRGQYDEVPSELAKWKYDNGKVITGLVNRRAAEGGLWSQGLPVVSASVNVDGERLLDKPGVADVVKTSLSGAGGAMATGLATGGLPEPLVWAISVSLVAGVVATVYYFIFRR
jgi:lysozyme